MITVVKSIETVVVEDVKTKIVEVGVVGPQGPSGEGTAVTSVNTRIGDIVLTSTDVGLGNVDNTSDVNKPISSATQTALNAKASADHDSTHAPGGSDELPWTTIHGRGDTASKPAAAAGNAGYLYFDTTLSKLQRSNGTTWEDVSEAGGGGSEPYTTLRYTQQTAIPAVADAGEIKHFAYSMGNFDTLAQINDLGVYLFAQPLFGVSGLIRYWQAEYGTTTPFLIGFTNTTTGTVSAKSISYAFTDSTPAVRYTTAASANSQAGTRSITSIPGRNQPHHPGSTYWARVFMTSVPSTSRAFFGVTENTAFITATVDPSAYNGVSMYGIGKSAGDTTWKVYHNNSAGSPVVIDTGISCTSNAFVDFMLHNNPASDAVSWWVRQKPFGSESIAMGVITDTSNLPSTIAALAPQLSINTGTGTAALVLEVCQQMYRAER